MNKNFQFSTFNFQRNPRGFIKRRFPQRFKKSAGFTLIEMAVATGLFAILTVSAVSIMIAASKAQLSIQRVQTSIDNIRFSLELITKEMRVGASYKNPSTGECGEDSGTDIVQFVTSTSPPERRYFVRNGVLRRIKKASVIAVADCLGLGDISVPFTSDDIRVERFRVILRGNTSGSSDGQPWAMFNVKATAFDPRGVSNFSMTLQTSVVQRIRDFP
jgi:prepilin-type N-terminal cleavage/methylation domain-containing protein